MGSLLYRLKLLLLVLIAVLAMTGQGLAQDFGDDQVVDPLGNYPLIQEPGLAQEEATQEETVQEEQGCLPEEVGQPEPPPEKDRLFLSFSAGYLTPAKVESTDGRFSFAQTELFGSYSYFSLRLNEDIYFWENKDRLPFGNGRDDPWKNLHSISVEGQYGNKINERWSYYLTGEVYSRFEQEIGGGGVVARTILGYTILSKYRLVAGVKGEYNAVFWSVSPVLGITNIKAGTGSGPPKLGWTAYVGLPEEIALTYRFTPKFAVSLNYTSNTYVYQLADKSVVVPEGFLKINDKFVGAVLKFNPLEDLFFNVGGGYVFDRKYAFYDTEAVHLQTYDVDPGIIGVARLSYRF